MSAAAWELGRRCANGVERPDLFLVTDFVDLSQLQAFLPADWADIPRVLYMHENQLTYPERGGADRDNSWGFKNVLSCLAADRVIFNSAFHRNAFGAAADALLKRLPKPNPRAELQAALKAASVIGPGIPFEEIRLGTGGQDPAPLRVLFNHRWEHDKDPTAFLQAAVEARSRGAEFELVILGEDFESAEELPGAALLAELAGCIGQRGFLESRDAYFEALGRSDVVVSTAQHEFYGIALLEAVAAGCTPLAPARLAYPEVLPELAREGQLYGDAEELTGRLVELARDPQPLRDPKVRARLRASVADEDVVSKVECLDRLVDEQVSED